MRILLIVCLLLTVGCGTGDLPIVGSDDCDKEAVAENLNEIAERWDDALDVASSTSRIALSGPVGDLQEIRRETRQQDWPECAQAAQQELVEMMDEMIKGFIAFMGQESESEVQEYFEKAESHRAAFRRELRALRD